MYVLRLPLYAPTANFWAYSATKRRSSTCFVRSQTRIHAIRTEIVEKSACKVIDRVLSFLKPRCDCVLSVALAVSLFMVAPAWSVNESDDLLEVSPTFPAPQERTVLPPTPLEYPPLPEVKLPTYIQETLGNGLEVFLLEDHEVPLVKGMLLMRGGQYSSPSDKVGLPSLAAAVQRAGGSMAHPGEVMDDLLEDLAASIEFSAGQQAISVDFSCIKEDVPTIMGLLAELVRNPQLPEDKVTLYKSQYKNIIEHRYDNPSNVAKAELRKLLYGRNSLYARQATLSQVASITRQDVVNFIGTWQRPDTAVIGLVGDFKSSEMLIQVKKAFGSWREAVGQPVRPPAIPAEDPKIHWQELKAFAGPAEGDVAGEQSSEIRDLPPSVYLVDRPGVTQANVFVGEPGVSLTDPDVYALDVLSTILNSFGGKLFDEVRSREGLAYSVSGGWDTPPDHPGLFVAAGETSSPGEFLVALEHVLGESSRVPPSPKELDLAKSETVNSFVFNFASTSAQLQRILVYHILGLPQDYLFQYKDAVEALTSPEIQLAASRHLHPSEHTVVVVGSAELFRPSLEAVGLEVIPLELDEL